MLPEDFDGRSSILVVLLLTVVAFKQVVGQYLPKLPYLTYLDRYTLAGLSLVVIIGVIHAAMAAASICVSDPTRKPTLCGNVLGNTTQHDVDHADFICLVVSAVCWIVYQIFEIFTICRTHSRLSADAAISKDVEVILPAETELSTPKRADEKKV